MYGVYYDVPVDERLYGRVKAEIGSERPEGQLVHVVSKLDTGELRHYAVWESKELWEAFQRERVAPAVGRVLAGMGMSGTTPPRPQVTELDLVDVQIG